jgi:hypothetical protein
MKWLVTGLFVQPCFVKVLFKEEKLLKLQKWNYQIGDVKSWNIELLQLEICTENRT